MFPIDSAPEDAPYLRQVFVSWPRRSAPESGSWIGGPQTPMSGASTARSGGHCGQPSANSRRCLREQRRIASYLLQAGHYVARTGFGTIPRMLAFLADATTRAEAKGTAANGQRRRTARRRIPVPGLHRRRSLIVDADCEPDPQVPERGDAMETPHNASPVRVIEEVDGIDRLEPLGALPEPVGRPGPRSPRGRGPTPLTSPAPSPTPNDYLSASTPARPRRVAPRPAAVPVLRGSRSARTGAASRCSPATRTARSPTRLTSPRDAAATDEISTPPSRRWWSTPWPGAGIPLCAEAATHGHSELAPNPLDEFGRLVPGLRSSMSAARKALLKAEVFLDVRACHGDLSPDELDLASCSPAGPGGRSARRWPAPRYGPSGLPISVRAQAASRLHPGRQTRRDGGHRAALARLYMPSIAGSAEHSTVLQHRPPRPRRHTELGTAGT